MYAVAQALLLDLDMSFSKHSAVIAAFGQHFAKTEVLPKEFHRHLIEAQQDRHIGDYVNEREVSAAEAGRHIENARRFLDSAKNYLQR